MLYSLLSIEQLGVANQLIELAHAKSCHQLAHFLSDEEEVVDNVLGFTLKLLSQSRILGRDADRAGVEMAFAHHDAAGGYQRCGGKAEFIGAQQRADHDV